METQTTELTVGTWVKIADQHLIDNGSKGKITKIDRRRKPATMIVALKRDGGDHNVIVTADQVTTELHTPAENAFMELHLAAGQMTRSKAYIEGRIAGLVEDLRRCADDIERNHIMHRDYHEREDGWLDRGPAAHAADAMHKFLWMIPNAHTDDLPRHSAEYATWRARYLKLNAEYAALYGDFTDEQAARLSKALGLEG